MDVQKQYKEKGGKSPTPKSKGEGTYEEKNDGNADAGMMAVAGTGGNSYGRRLCESSRS